MTDTRFAKDGFEVFAVALGDRGSAIAIWLWSGVRMLVSGESMAWLALGSGCTDLAFELRELA